MQWKFGVVGNTNVQMIHFVSQKYLPIGQIANAEHMNQTFQISNCLLDLHFAIFRVFEFRKYITHINVYVYYLYHFVNCF